MATGSNDSLVSVLQAKGHQSGGLDIIEQESHLLVPGFNIVHSSIQKVLKIPTDYYGQHHYTG